MRIVLISTLLLTAGCATSTAGLGEKSVAVSFSGTRPAEEAASCLATELAGSPQLLRMGEGHFVVTRANAYGVPIIRWDIHSTPGGNRMELRGSFGIGKGEEKARACSGAPAA